jgi:hypothetical protein
VLDKTVYVGRTGKAPLIMISTGLSFHPHSLTALPPKRTPVPTEKEVKWAPEPFWMFCRREFFAPAVIRTTDRSVGLTCQSRRLTSNKHRRTMRGVRLSYRYDAVSIGM